MHFNLMPKSIHYMLSLLTLQQLSPTFAPWSSEYSGWHTRAIFHNSTDPPFTPTREHFVFATSYNTMAFQDLFELALFRPNVAINAAGHVLELSSDDFYGMTRLADEVISFSNATDPWTSGWRIYSPVSCRASSQLRVSKGPEGDLAEAGVYAYSKDCRMLDDGAALPQAPWELFGLVKESNEEREDLSEGNREIIAEVQEIYNDAPRRAERAR